MENLLKISVPLSNQAFWASFSDQNISLDAIIREAIKTLDANGRSQESQQLEKLYEDHSIFSNGTMFGKGALFRELQPEIKIVNGQSIGFAQIDLIKWHIGGI